MNISSEMLRRLKSRGMSDMEIGTLLGVPTSKIKNLRYKYGIDGLPSVFRPRGPQQPNPLDGDGWPEVMSPAERDKRWAKYFKKLGHDHSADDLRLKPMTRMLAQPDASHLHGLGATSLEFP